MKKIRPVFLAALTAVLALLLAASASAGVYYTIGDVDNDGAVTPGDARLALRAAVYLEDIPEGSNAFLAADADYDGKITSADARLILRGSVGLETLIEFGTLLEDAPEYRLGLNSWWWDWDENNNPYVDVIMVAQNLSDRDETFFFYDWGLNKVMTPSYMLLENNFCWLPPKSAAYFIYRIYPDGIPEGASIAPTGEVAFSFDVDYYNPNDESSDFTFISEGKHMVYDESLLEYNYYSAPFPDRAFVSDRYSRYHSMGPRVENGYYPNDTYSNAILFQNTSDFDQHIYIELEKVNGRSAFDPELGMNPSTYQTVYAGYSCVTGFNLYYDYEYNDSMWVLNRLGILPTEVYSFDYTMLVYEKGTDRLLSRTSTNTTIS